MAIKMGMLGAVVFAVVDAMWQAMPVREIIAAKLANQSITTGGNLDIHYNTRPIPRCPVVVKQRITGCGEYDIGSISVDSFPPERPMSIRVPRELFDGSGGKAMCQYQAIIEYDCGDNKRGTMVQTIPFVVEK